MMTSQQVADAFNAAGVTTPEEAAEIIGAAKVLVARSKLSYALDAARADATQMHADAEAKVQAATAALAAKDAELLAVLAPS